jgi:hypothetical protein
MFAVCSIASEVKAELSNILSEGKVEMRLRNSDHSEVKSRPGRFIPFNLIIPSSESNSPKAMACQKLHNSTFLSIFVMRFISETVILPLFLFLLAKHPKFQPLGLYMAILWLLISYMQYIAYRVDECLTMGDIEITRSRMSNSPDVDWPKGVAPKWVKFYVSWQFFQYCNGYVVLGAAYCFLQQLGSQYDPALGASTRFKRIFDALLVLSGLTGAALQWGFYYLTSSVRDLAEWDKVASRALVFPGFNWAWHVIAFLNLIATTFLIRGKKGQNKVRCI